MTEMISDSELLESLNDLLSIKDIEDKSDNGLQVDAPGQINKMTFAVDVRRDIVDEAVEAEADLLFVHHGLIWGDGFGSVTGKEYEIVRELIKNDLALYGAHLPLDLHPEVGNNVELARLIGAKIKEPFMEYNETKIARMAKLKKEKKIKELAEVLENKLETETYVVNGNRKVKQIGILTGKGGQALKAAKRNGAELLITGERTYTAYNNALDLDMGLIFAGHYATETLGVRRMQKYIDKEYDIETEFISSPTTI